MAPRKLTGYHGTAAFLSPTSWICCYLSFCSIGKKQPREEVHIKPGFKIPPLDSPWRPQCTPAVFHLLVWVCLRCLAEAIPPFTDHAHSVQMAFQDVESTGGLKDCHVDLSVHFINDPLGGSGDHCMSLFSSRVNTNLHPSQNIPTW